MLRAVVLTQYRRVTDGQTDEIAVASTALAKRRAVKTKDFWRGQKLVRVNRESCVIRVRVNEV